MQPEKTEYVFPLAALLWCLTVGSAQPGALQGSSDSKAIDNLSVRDQNVAPLVTIPSPSELLGPQKPTKPDENAPLVKSPSELIGAEEPAKPDDNAPLVIKLPTGGVVLPSGELIGVQKQTNSAQVPTENEPARFSFVVFSLFMMLAIGALAALIWWTERLRQHSSYHHHEGGR
jgi:hypothetical protein